MKNSDVFVLSSLSEGLPNVVIEAMACGVPVISTRCPSGPEEIITNKVNGILVPVKDEKALAESIVDLLKNKDKAKRLSEEGVKRAEYFDAKKIVRQYEKIFKEI
ncbi:Lipopolysaccharide biosynthesis (fragment) [groundwater metagenome]|uniref:Lipopolysaccharide biosynthesis n=1 Tax=groundwater metagenome TaxID=717931 RepID=A0A098E9H0_9ZZZZ